MTKKMITLVAIVFITCFLTGSRISGMNRICYYDCGSGSAAITVAAYELCPLTINR